jgi:hypothetical protein
MHLTLSYFSIVEWEGVFKILGLSSRADLQTIFEQLRAATPQGKTKSCSISSTCRLLPIHRHLLFLITK